MFCTFWLGNVLRATTACTFSSLIWPDGSAPAALASLLFDPPEPQIIGKTGWIATFLLFPHLHLLSSDSFSSLIFSLLFVFSDYSHLCLSICPFVGNLTSKLLRYLTCVFWLTNMGCLAYGRKKLKSTCHQIFGEGNMATLHLLEHFDPKPQQFMSKASILTVKPSCHLLYTLRIPPVIKRGNGKSIIYMWCFH